MKTTISSSSSILSVGDVVEHNPPASPMSPLPRGRGFLTRLTKPSQRPELNIWEVRFFDGETFSVMEGYLKKIQGSVDTNVPT